MEFRSASPEETEAIAGNIAKTLFPGAIVALWGGLGAGKTAFVRGLARGLGVRGRVSSPTFTLLHEHAGNPALYHFDLYRLDEDGLGDLGAEDYFGGRGICAVEWPDNAGGLLPDDRLDVTLEPDGETGRIIRLKAHGAAHEAILKELTI